MLKKYFILAFIFAGLSTAVFAGDSTKVKYAAVIHFRSECCGVPDNKPVYDYVTAFRARYHTKPIAVTRVGPLGREGEYDLMFKLKELNSGKRKKFIAGLEKLLPTLNKPGMADIEKNVVFDHHMRGSRATAKTEFL